MVAKRIIPCLDINKGRVVKGVNFLNLRDAGDPVRNAQFYEKEGADELVFLDITASFERRETTIELVRKIAKVVFMPFTVGGGINKIEDIRALLLAGAEKISLNTAAVENPKLIREASKRFGSQCVVVAIDAKRRTKDVGRRTKNAKTSHIQASNNERTPHGLRPEWEVFIHGGRTPTGLDAVAWAKQAQKLGAGEILLTSMDYDGTKDGFDIALTKAITSTVSIPVIASGGAGKPEHFSQLFKNTTATAGLAASIFHYREYRIKEIKEYAKKRGAEVRL